MADHAATRALRTRLPAAARPAVRAAAVVGEAAVVAPGPAAEVTKQSV